MISYAGSSRCTIYLGLPFVLNNRTVLNQLWSPGPGLLVRQQRSNDVFLCLTAEGSCYSCYLNVLFAMQVQHYHTWSANG